MSARIALDPAAMVDEAVRGRLEALPDMVRVRGDAVPLDYEIQAGEGVARVRLREGQAKRLRDGRPATARPPAPVRGPARPTRATAGRHRSPTLQAALRRAPRTDRVGRGWGQVPARPPRASRSGAARSGAGRRRTSRPTGSPSVGPGPLTIHCAPVDPPNVMKERGRCRAHRLRRPKRVRHPRDRLKRLRQLRRDFARRFHVHL